MVTAEDEGLESVVVAGVTTDKKTTKITLRSVPDTPGIAATLFEALAQARIVVDMIIQNVSLDGHTDMTFTVAEDDADNAGRTATVALGEGWTPDVVLDREVVKVSIVGLGMRSHAGVAARMFRILSDEGVNIEAISTSEIKVSCLIASKYAELAVRELHQGFGLGASA